METPDLPQLPDPLRLSSCATLAILVSVAGFLLPRASPLMASESWPGFRGPTQDGRCDSESVPLRWSESENVRWKTRVHGKAWSSPVVLAGQVWLTTASEDGTRLGAIRVDRATGEITLDLLLFRIASPRPLGNDVNSYGSPTAAIEPGRVYLHFGSYGTACLDTETGKTLWERRDLECNHLRGPASSPVLFGDLLILTFDGSDRQYLVALEKRTGRTRWLTPRSTDFDDLDPNGRPRGDGDFRKAFNTPLLVEAGGRLQLISPGAKAVFAYDPRDGSELWTARYGGHSSASRTVAAEGLAFVNTGYSRAQLWAIRVDLRGDVTEGGVVWKATSNIPRRSSPILTGGRLYFTSDNGIASCLEARTGREIWKARLGGRYSASPVLVAGRIYFFDEEGTTTVVRPGAKLEILARNHLDDGFMASAAVAGRAFYLRTRTHLYRVEE